MSSLLSNLPEIVGDAEDIARFLTQSNQFSKAKRLVKLVAFLPNPKNREKSVLRHGADDLGGLWKIGAEQMNGVTIHGAAIVKAQFIRAAQLDVVAAEPPLRHANIVGWPSYPDPEWERSRHMAMAASIAEFATLFLA
jgi:hypothetical protein